MFIPDSLYEQILHHTVIATVDLIVLNQDQKILLGMRTNQPLKGIYYLPGGRIHKDETMIQAAQRKAKQEIGINIDPNRLMFVGVYDDMFKNSEFGESSTHCIAITFKYQLDQKESDMIQSDHQYDDMRFFDYHDIFLDPVLRHRLDKIQESYHISL